MVGELEMPHAFAGSGIQTNDTLGKEVVTKPMAAVVVVRGRSERDIDVTELQVGAQRSPRVGGAGVPPRAIFPGLVSELTLLRDRVELPDFFARANIEAPDVAGRPQLVPEAVKDHRSYDDHVTDDHGSPHELVVAPWDGTSQSLRGVDGSVGAKVGDRLTRPGVEGVEIGIARRQENARLLAVRPVGDASRVEARVRRPCPLPRTWVEDPERLSRRRIDRRGLTERRL